MFRPSAGLDFSRLTESELEYFQVFQDVYEHGQTPKSETLGRMLKSGHLTVENNLTREHDLLRMTPDGLTLFEYLQKKATPEGRVGT